MPSKTVRPVTCPVALPELSLFILLLAAVAVAQNPVRLAGTLAYTQRGDVWVKCDDRYRDEYPVWAKDGRHVVFVRMDERDSVSVWSIEIGNGRLLKLVDEIGGLEAKDSWFGFYGHLSWSSHVAFSSNE